MLPGVLLVLFSCVPAEEPNPWYDDQAPSDGQIGDAGADDGGVTGDGGGDGGTAEDGGSEDGGSEDGGGEDGGGDDGGSEDGGSEALCGPGDWAEWEPERVLEGPEGSVAGEAIAAADLDGDGDDDVVVGAPWAKTEDGAVFVLRGPFGSGELGENAPRISGDDRGQLGAGVAAGLDLTGDGLADIAAAAPDTDPYSEVFLFAGPVTGDLGTADAVAMVTSDCSGATLGSGLGLLDDTDGHGTAGLLAFSTYCEGHHDDPNEGAAWLLEAPLHGDLDVDDLSWTLTAAGGFDILSGSLLTDDVDGDGVSDVVLGASADLGALVFLGPLAGHADGDDADAALLGTTGTTGLLYVLSAADVDGDGAGDLLVGEPDAAAGGTRRGAVYAWTDGLADGSLGDAASIVRGTADNDKLGRAGTVLPGGDAPRLVVAAQGADESSSSSDNNGAVYMLDCLDLGVQGLDAVDAVALGGRGEQLGDVVVGAEIDRTDVLFVGNRYASDWAGEVWLLEAP